MGPKPRSETRELGHELRSDARDNRRRILEVAREAFAVQGLDVPIREIARRAQVGAATVYRHFPTKEALFAEAFAEQMAGCTATVERGLAQADPWRGFCLVVEKLMVVNALDRGFSRALTSRLPVTDHFTTHRDYTMRLMLQLVRNAKEAGGLRADFVLEDLIMALMANDGIRADSPAMRAAASRRFAALMIQSFRADPVPAPLPPAVRLPLPVLPTLGVR